MIEVSLVIYAQPQKHQRAALFLQQFAIQSAFRETALSSIVMQPYIELFM